MVRLFDNGTEEGIYPWSGAWPPSAVVAVATVKAPGRESVRVVMDAIEWVLGYALAPNTQAVAIYDREHQSGIGLTSPAVFHRRIGIVTTTEEQA